MIFHLSALQSAQALPVENAHSSLAVPDPPFLGPIPTLQQNIWPHQTRPVLLKVREENRLEILNCFPTVQVSRGAVALHWGL